MGQKHVFILESKEVLKEYWDNVKGQNSQCEGTQSGQIQEP